MKRILNTILALFLLIVPLTKFGVFAEHQSNNTLLIEKNVHETGTLLSSPKTITIPEVQTRIYKLKTLENFCEVVREGRGTLSLRKGYRDSAPLQGVKILAGKFFCIFFPKRHFYVR